MYLVEAMTMLLTRKSMLAGFRGWHSKRLDDLGSEKNASDDLLW
jgi:hypothetical protein